MDDEHKHPLESRILLIIILMGAIHSLIYVFLIPPWQHYDEPTHFEHAWLIVNRSGLPEPGDYDLYMRREVAASMVEHGFYEGLGPPPNLLAQKPIYLGYSELRHPPLYYALVSLPLHVMPHADFALQLSASRMVSWILYMLTLWISYRVACKLSVPFLLRVSVPGFVAILPAFTDLMSSVNNDVGAVVAFSLFLLASVHLLVEGFSVRRMIWVIGAAILCFFTKNTVAPAVLLLPFAVFIRLCVTRGNTLWCLMIMVGFILISLVGTLSWGDAAYWYRGIHGTYQRKNTRCTDCEAPIGESALHLASGASRELIQYLPKETVSALQGETITWGGWVWAEQKVEVKGPVVYDGVQKSGERLHIDVVPSFFTQTTAISENADRLSVELTLDSTDENAGTDVYYDGLFLVAGEWLTAETPIFDQSVAETGIWGDKRFTNYLRNGSAEKAWPRVRPWVEEHAGAVLPWPYSAAVFLASVLDWQRTGWLYGRVSWNLIETFWARFAWGHIGLADPFYWFAGILTVLGVAGGLTAIIKDDALKSIQRKRAWLFLFLSGLLIWLSSLMRFHPVLGVRPFIPAARYVYPAIIPTALVLVQGWGGLWESKKWRMRMIGVGLGLILLLAMASLYTIVDFYYL